MASLLIVICISFLSHFRIAGSWFYSSSNRLGLISGLLGHILGSCEGGGGKVHGMVVT